MRLFDGPVGGALPPRDGVDAAWTCSGILSPLRQSTEGEEEEEEEGEEENLLQQVWYLDEDF